MRKKTSKVVKVMDWLDNGCYPGSVLFICGYTYDEIMPLLKRKKAFDWYSGIEGDKETFDDGSWFASRRYTKDGKQMLYIICNKVFEFTDTDYCSLAHEITHICQYFLPYYFDRNKEHEAEAYYHTHIMQQCLKALRG